MKAKIVLGLQFGDEGKGRTVDFLVKNNPYNSIVVRFSGGQNCGHTVMLEDGTKHIFSSFGSGTLRGVPTYISEYCTIYLNSIHNEKKELLKKRSKIELIVHPKTILTTPYDVYFNRANVDTREHGTTGVGISTTMKRTLETGYKLYAIDLINPDVCLAKLAEIKKYYERISPSIMENEALQHEEKLFIELIKSSPIDRLSDYDYLISYENIVFEGSQGILLDMDHGIFPNVTYANTTSKNAIKICEELGIDDIQLYYITRCYQTRHGNGWMSNQQPISLINNENEINVFNEFQGEFKVGEIDYKLINYAINVDLIYNKKYVSSPKVNLVITCLDQRPDFEFDITQVPSINNPFINIIKMNSPSNDKIPSTETIA